MIFSDRPPAARSNARNWRAQKGGTVETEPDGAPAQRRIFLLDVAHVGQHLVAADIERAEGHRLVVGRIENRPVERVLLARPREVRRDHELQLSPEQADAGGARIGDMRQVDAQAGIDQQRDFFAVLVTQG